MRANEVREKFLQFFEKRGHQRVASSSLVPEGDPTLLFTNAGMNQFKGLFLGQEKRGYTRACSSQKCVRAGGKHNDLENVGFTARHHTFFEMLGNFSFGDYFKEDAIAFCWELLTKDFALDPKKLYVTIYKDDDDAEKIWKKVTGFGSDKILRFGEKENFWQMGDTGPCGPCSEVHYDQGKELSCGRPDCGVNCASDVCDRYLEIWNNVFMQFERDASGKMTPLPKPSIDTGMGLERITSILQGKKSNYDIDLFQGIISTVAEIAKKKYGSDKNADASMRVIADHARATAFLIGDGVLPSNEGRGYVLRRIMRRAIRHAYKLDIDKPRFDEVVGRVADEMGDAYPDLRSKKGYVMERTQAEEKSFRQTLATGLKLLNETFEKVKGTKHVPGDVAFKLHDTYGFPVDLTRVIAAERGFGVDEAGYEKRMTEQQERGKASWTGDKADEGAKAVVSETATKEAKDAFAKVGAAEGRLDDVLEKAGVGDLKQDFERWAKADRSRTLSGRSRVLLTFDASGKQAALDKGTWGAIVAWWSPFYAEGGGQVGDRGVIRGENGAEFEVEDTQKIGGDATLPPLHFGKVTKGSFRAKDTVELQVREEHRAPARAHHTATHLMHSALRHVLGTHVKQQGSLVEPTRLRFDFSHFQPVTMADLRKIEREVNDAIFRNMAAKHEEMSYADAIAKGALAFFGDKYGANVRVLSIGDYSKELCGGTHVAATGEIGLFRFLHEEGIAAGVRRVEAVTQSAALEYAHRTEDLLRSSAEILKSTTEALPERIQQLVEEKKALAKELDKLRGQIATASAGDLVSKAREVKGIKVLAEIVEVADASGLREFAEKLRDKLGKGVVIVGATIDGKASLVAAVSKDLQGTVKAGDLIKEIAPVVGGKGGGKPDMAMGGGPQTDKVRAALDHAIALLSR